MRAATVTRYGPPEAVRIEDRATPRIGDDKILVRVHAAAVTSADARIRAARFPSGFSIPARLAFGITRPRRAVLGSAFSGVVEAIGSESNPSGEATGRRNTSGRGEQPEDSGGASLAVGDSVCGMTGARLGAHAELVAVRTSRIVRKPAEISHDEAAGVLFGGTTALFFLRDRAAIAPGMSVLVNGASGAVGSNAVQLARHFGVEVTAITSTPNIPLAYRLGASKVIDYTTTPLDGLADRFDVVFDAVGSLDIATGRGLLNDDGRLILAVATLGQTIRARGNVIAGPAPERPQDFAELVELVAQRQLEVVIDGSLPLDDIVDAHRRVDTARKVGNLLVHPSVA